MKANNYNNNDNSERSFITMFISIMIMSILLLLFSLNSSGGNYSTNRDTIAKFISFISIKGDSANALKWTVYNQEIEGYYIIERSFDNDAFEYAGHLQGNPDHLNHITYYTFTDSIKPSKLIYYRITHINFEGKVIQSNIIKIKANKMNPKRVAKRKLALNKARSINKNNPVDLNISDNSFTDSNSPLNEKRKNNLTSCGMFVSSN